MILEVLHLPAHMAFALVSDGQMCPALGPPTPLVGFVDLPTNSTTKPTATAMNKTMLEGFRATNRSPLHLLASKYGIKPL